MYRLAVGFSWERKDGGSHNNSMNFGLENKREARVRDIRYL